MTTPQPPALLRAAHHPSPVDPAATRTWCAYADGSHTYRDTRPATSRAPGAPAYIWQGAHGTGTPPLGLTWHDVKPAQP